MARILVISNLFPPEARGGYELACGDVVRQWREAGHVVQVLSGSDASLPLTSVHVPVAPRLRRPSIERAAHQALRAALAKGPDVVSVWNMAGLPVSLLAALADAGVPVVYVVADAWPVRSPATDPWLRSVEQLPAPVAAALGRLASVPISIPALGPTGRWIFCSRSLRDLVLSASPEHGPYDDTAIVPLGVDLDDFPLAAEADDRPWRGRLLFVGRLDPVKGIDTLVRAMALLPDATLDVLGPAEAHHLQRIGRLIDTLGLDDRVHIGSATREQLAARYQDADVCVFPSEWQEPFGIVPLEAMACATPVVATGVGGSGDYLRDGENALLFAPGDPADLAVAIKRLADDPPLRRRLATAGLEVAAHFTTVRLADELLPLHLP